MLTEPAPLQSRHPYRASMLTETACLQRQRAIQSQHAYRAGTLTEPACVQRRHAYRGSVQYRASTLTEPAPLQSQHAYRGSTFALTAVVCHEEVISQLAADTVSSGASVGFSGSRFRTGSFGQVVSLGLKVSSFGQVVSLGLKVGSDNDDRFPSVFG